MKNGLLVWNIVLTVIAGYLLFSHFGGKQKTAGSKNTAGRDSTANSSAFRIAYFVMDSIENNFVMVKDVKEEITKREEEYNNSLSKLEYPYQKKLQEYRDKEKNGTLTQADVEQAPMVLKQLEEKIRGLKLSLDQEYQDFVMRRNLNVKKKIEDFLIEYNKTRNFSYIVSYEQGLFYYKDTAYNITSDLVKGLNDEYKTKKD